MGPVPSFAVASQDFATGIPRARRRSFPDHRGSCSKRICAKTFELCGTFLGANETKLIKGSVKLPDALPATSREELGCHYRIRGRMEAFGNDPDSGYKEIQVALPPT